MSRCPNCGGRLLLAHRGSTLDCGTCAYSGPVPRRHGPTMRKHWSADQGVLLLPPVVVDHLRQSNTPRDLATGRARCRACGEIIVKGEICFTEMYAFPGSHGWGTLCYVHVEPCESKGE